MRRSLSKSLLSFSFRSSNRIGSDELISQSKSVSGENLLYPRLDLLASVENLQRELEEKDKLINDLRRQVESLSICHQQPLKHPGRRCLSSLSRSTSITSFGAWIKQKSRRQSAGPTLWPFSQRSSRMDSAKKSSDHYQNNPKRLFTDTPSRLSSLNRFTYRQIMEGSVPMNELLVEHLEWHLTDEDLLERLSICREFLADLEKGDLEDRKYRASLTMEQFLVTNRLTDRVD